MARLRDIDIRTADPLGLAAFLERMFGFRVLRVDEKHGSVVMTDGYIYLAIAKTGNGHEAASDSGVTVNHIGFEVDDLDEACGLAEGMGCTESNRSTPKTRFYSWRDEFDVEIRAAGWGWDNMIEANTTLYQLEPAPDSPAVTAKMCLVDPTDVVGTGARGHMTRVLAAADLPHGCAARVELKGTEGAVLLVNVDGEFYAADDGCPHMPRAGRLSEGRRDGALVECPIHGSCFDLLTSAVLEPPARRGPSTLDVAVLNGYVCVNISPLTMATPPRPRDRAPRGVGVERSGDTTQ